jgi:hypothetical protein
MSKADLVEVPTFKLDPEAKYLIVIDSRAFTAEDAFKLTKYLKKMGMNNAVAMMVDGDPATAVRVIEDPKETETDSEPTT